MHVYRVICDFTDLYIRSIAKFRTPGDANFRAPGDAKFGTTIDAEQILLDIPQRHACQYCKKTFKNRKNLNEHVAHHEGRDRYWCAICKRGFQLKPHYEGHINKHNNVRPYQCVLCKKSFFFSQGLRTHYAACKSRLAS